MTVKEALKKLEGKKFEITDCSLKIFNQDLSVKDEFEGSKLGDLFAQFENKNFEHIYLYETWIHFTEFRFSSFDDNNYVDLIQKKNCKTDVKRIDIQSLDDFIEILENLENEFKKNFN